MSTGTPRTTLAQGPSRFLLIVTIGAMLGSVANAAEIPSLDEIKAHFQQQREKIDSLYVASRTEEKPCVDVDVLLSLPGFELKVLLVNEEKHFALKGDKRYSRTLRSPDTKYLRPVGEPPRLRPNASRLERESHKRLMESYERMEKRRAKAERRGSKTEFAEGPEPDFIKAFNGRTQWSRRADKDGSVQFTIDRPGRLQHWFQPSVYLMAVGWAFLDPLDEEQSALDTQRMFYLPELLQRWPYSVSDEIEEVDGAECVVLTGKPEVTITIGEVTETMSYDDKLWLDLEHGLAIRQRETRTQGFDGRRVNSDFQEVMPGLWLPKKSESQTPAPPGAPEELQGRPVMVGVLTLLKCVVNEVPDDLFDMVPKPGERVLDLRDPKLRRP